MLPGHRGRVTAEKMPQCETRNSLGNPEKLLVSQLLCPCEIPMKNSFPGRGHSQLNCHVSYMKVCLFLSLLIEIPSPAMLLKTLKPKRISGLSSLDSWDYIFTRMPSCLRSFKRALHSYMKYWRKCREGSIHSPSFAAVSCPFQLTMKLKPPREKRVSHVIFILEQSIKSSP